jgi:hypothetical protein
MDIKILKSNAKTIAAELSWLSLVIDTRMKIYWGKPGKYKDIHDVPPPVISKDDSLYAQIVNHYGMSVPERLILLLSLAPHIQPQLLDIFFVKNVDYDRGFTEFGGIKGQYHSGFIPTGETVAFLLAGNNLEARFGILQFFSEDHFFQRFKILKLVNANAGEPYLSGMLSLSAEYMNYFTSGATHKPDYNINFPAKLLHTELDWGDLVLDDQTLQQVLEIHDWIKYGDTMLNEWGMKKKIKPGFRSLFYGPPGTGKTLAACLLGKSAGLDIYRIDLSMVVSKYIGETEKNLANIFDQAQNKNWILFFDEADSLFGKRTQTNNSNDRHANQEISYLLQRIEDFPGVVILATNIKANLDEAFTRRFQSMIYFAVPNAFQRKKLWANSFSDKTVFEEKINLDEIAAKYELTGGAIINVSRHCSLMALKRQDNIIRLKDIIEGIRREFSKDGKII